MPAAACSACVRTRLTLTELHDQRQLRQLSAAAFTTGVGTVHHRQHHRGGEHGHHQRARCLGTIASQGNNLIGETDGSSGWVGSDLTGTIARPLDPLLAPLGNYGGPTQTMALLPGSPAIDAGNNALIPAGITTDQRGLPRIVNSSVDIGAFESTGFNIAVTSGSGQSTSILTAFPAPLVVTVTAKNPNEPVAGGLVTFLPPPSGASATLGGSPATISGHRHGERHRRGQRHRR